MTVRRIHENGPVAGIRDLDGAQAPRRNDMQSPYRVVMPAKGANPSTTVEVTPTGLDHVHVSTERTQKLMLRGVVYYVSAHLYHWSHGSWRVGREDQTEYQRTSELYVSRVDRYGSDSYPSLAARRDITMALEACIDAWAASAPGARAIQHAEARRLQTELERAEATYVETNAALEVARAATETARAAYLAFVEGQPEAAMTAFATEDR